MPRAIACILFIASTLCGCAVQAPIEAPRPDTADTAASDTLGQWLDQIQEVNAMDSTEVARQLHGVDKATGTGPLFYFALLNQRTQSYGAWTVARDAFQALEEDEEIPMQQRQLAAVLRQYTQYRINAYARYNALLGEQSKLQQELEDAAQDKRQLEQKIKALTELETAISTRQED